MSISHWLNKPYPQIDQISIKISISFLVGLVCFMFLIIFEPFGIDRIESTSFVAGFGLNAIISLLINYFIFPILFPKFYQPSAWSVKKELVFFISNLLIIGILNYLYNKMIGRSFSPQYSLWYFLYITTMVGILPILLMTYLTELIARKRNSSEAEKLELAKFTNLDHQKDDEEKSISIKDESASGNELSMTLSSFLYASSSNNYCEIFYQEDQVVHKKLLRISLKKLADQMDEFSDILRCHKSYLVNKQNITKISGNARSLVLSVNNTSDKIPVSRSFDRALLQ